VRRLIVALAQPTRDGDRELVLLTTVPAGAAGAVALADLYPTRWRIETYQPWSTSSRVVYVVDERRDVWRETLAA
jgi:hypothetical protein